MKTLLSISFIALAAVAVSASGAHADNAKGTCNSVTAGALRPAQQCFRSGCFEGDPVCDEAGAAFFRFFGTPGCGEAFANGELEGLSGNATIQPAGPNAGDAKHLAEVICNAVLQCNFCTVAVGFGVCEAFCEPEPM